MSACSNTIIESFILNSDLVYQLYLNKLKQKIMPTSPSHNYQKKKRLQMRPKHKSVQFHHNLSSWNYMHNLWLCLCCVYVYVFYSEGLSSDFQKEKWSQNTLRTTNLAYQKHSTLQRNKVGFVQVFFPHIHRGDPHYKVSLSNNSFILAKKLQYLQAHITIPRYPKTVYS